MRRLLATALIAGPLTFLGVAPAHAVPAPPAFSNIDASTPGHVTGTVTSDQPFVAVRLASDVPSTLLVLSAGSATFDLETWGFGSGSGTATVRGVACPTSTSDASACSAVATSTAFTPTDVTPQVTSWFTDDTIGPGQADPSITVSDTGGGVLHAIFVSDGPRFDVPVAHNGDTVLPADDDGTGYVRITRCATANPLECNDLGFTAPLQHDLEVRRNATAVWVRDVGVATAAAPSPVYTVVPVPSTPGGTYALSWHLEADGSPGIPVGTGGTPSGDLTDSAGIAVTLDTTDVPDGDYTVVGTLTLDDPSFGTYTDVPVDGGSLRVDKTGPIVNSVHRTRTYVRPESSAGDDVVTIDATGPNADFSDNWTVRGPTGALVRSFLASSTVVPGQSWEAQFDGRDEDGVPLPAGSYTVQLSDANGNLGLTLGIQVQRLRSRTFTKTVTARASKVDQYVGRCSRLASPSSHGWAGSLGYFANTRCRSTTGVDSTVATEHSVKLPAAASYQDVQISAYGGAAKGFGRSVAVMYYEDPSRRNQVAKTILGAKVGTWAGPRKAASTMVKKVGTARYVFWTAGTAARQHYDVKGFTVTVRYRAWV